MIQIELLTVVLMKIKIYIYVIYFCILSFTVLYHFRKNNTANKI